MTCVRHAPSTAGVWTSMEPQAWHAGELLVYVLRVEDLSVLR